jgi:hypothetical protein
MRRPEVLRSLRCIPTIRTVCRLPMSETGITPPRRIFELLEPMHHPLTTYLRALHEIRSSGSAVAETSYYGTLEHLLNEIGRSLKPKVRCIINLKNEGAGLPDGGLFTPDQLQRGTSQPGRTGDLLQKGMIPARGVIEVKGTGEDVTKTATSEQVSRYLKRYGQVLVTNYRDFALVGLPN